MSQPADLCARQVEILLVEDDFVDVMLLNRMCDKHGFPRVQHVVENGVQALRFLRREGEYVTAPRPDLVLLDLNMPCMGGAEVMQHMKADPALASILIAVVSTSLDREPDSEDAQADCYLKKPITPEDFERLLNLQTV